MDVQAIITAKSLPRFLPLPDSSIGIPRENQCSIWYPCKRRNSDQKADLMSDLRTVAIDVSMSSAWESFGFERETVSMVGSDDDRLGSGDRDRIGCLLGTFKRPHQLAPWRR
jgi:hypothetical protein